MTEGDLGLWCCVPYHTCDVTQALFTPFVLFVEIPNCSEASLLSQELVRHMFLPPTAPQFPPSVPVSYTHLTLPTNIAV